MNGTKHAPGELPDLISCATAAGALDCHPRTVRRMVAEGQLTGYRLGPRMLRVSRDEVAALARPIPTSAGGAA